MTYATLQLVFRVPAMMIPISDMKIPVNPEVYANKHKIHENNKAATGLYLFAESHDKREKSDLCDKILLVFSCRSSPSMHRDSPHV